MIDYFFQFASQAAAIATAAGTEYYNSIVGAWNPDTVSPNLQAWKPSQDVTTYQVIGGTIANPGSGGTNGAVTLTAVGGTGTAATATGTISGGQLTALTGIVNPGSYSVLPSNPVAVTGGNLVGATVNLQTLAIVTHTFLTGWFGAISKQQPPDATLLGVTQLLLAINRELSAAGQPAIIQNNVGPTINTYRFQPLFLGSNYPFGNLI
jgi:hypothetical protein